MASDLIKKIEIRNDRWFVSFDSGKEFGPYATALEMVNAHRRAVHEHYHPNNAERRRNLNAEAN